MKLETIEKRLTFSFSDEEVDSLFNEFDDLELVMPQHTFLIMLKKLFQFSGVKK